jgi:uncharacterized protein YprB with RNaseH-like and TPR domain
MLRQTFIHLEGIGAATERSLWSAGMRDWDALLDPNASVPRMGPARRRQIGEQLRESQRRFERGDARHFASLLSSNERWRLYTAFTERTAYVDIETTGMGGSAYTTVVGLYAEGRPRLFVRGVNLDDFPSAVEPYDVWVSYNGICFDAPFLVREFGTRIAPAAHIDLMYVLRAVGLTGGLKGVERACGIARPEGVRDLDGWDAVRLWHEYRRGNPESLRTLVTYNLEDILNLETLLEIGINRHIDQRRLPFEPVRVPHERAEYAALSERAVAEVGRLARAW